MREVKLKELLEAGCHFGHKASRWNPQSKPFIYREQDNIHIIDLVKTKKQLKKAGEAVKELGQEDKTLLMVGTKRQAAKLVKEAAEKAGLPYMVNRWIGGLITNWEQVKKNIQKMRDMREEAEGDGWSELPKHEQLEKKRDLQKLERVYEGVKELKGLPDGVFLVDVRLENTATRETNLADILSIGICDTNSNPDRVDIPVPSNDDAIGAVKYIAEYIADAYLEGKKAPREETKDKSEANK